MSSFQKHPLPLSEEQKEEYFEEIMYLYDICDEMVNVIGKDGITNRSQQVKLAEPLIAHFSEATDALSDIFTQYAKGNKLISVQDKHKIELEIRKVFGAIAQFAENSESLRT